MINPLISAFCIIRIYSYSLKSLFFFTCVVCLFSSLFGTNSWLCATHTHLSLSPTSHSPSPPPHTLSPSLIRNHPADPSHEKYQIFDLERKLLPVCLVQTDSKLSLLIFTRNEGPCCYHPSFGHRRRRFGRPGKHLGGFDMTMHPLERILGGGGKEEPSCNEGGKRQREKKEQGEKKRKKKKKKWGNEVERIKNNNMKLTHCPRFYLLHKPIVPPQLQVAV